MNNPQEISYEDDHTNDGTNQCSQWNVYNIYLDFYTLKKFPPIFSLFFFNPEKYKFHLDFFRNLFQDCSYFWLA